LVTFKAPDDETLMAVDAIRSSVQETSEGGEEAENADVATVDHDDSKPLSKPGAKADGELIKIESREHGLSSLNTWLLWFKHAGGLPFFATQVFLMTMDRFLYVATEYWLSFWTSAASKPKEIFGIEFPAQTDGRAAQGSYIWVYSAILLLSILATFVRSQWAVSGGSRCAKNVFFVMLQRVLESSNGILRNYAHGSRLSTDSRTIPK
jgi:hypothetical protein